MLPQAWGSVQVLTTGSWPTPAAVKCTLPRELEACCDDFRAFYLHSHSGRKLAWQTNMGNAGTHSSCTPPRGWKDLVAVLVHPPAAARVGQTCCWLDECA